MSTQGQSPEAVIAESERLLKEITPGEWRQDVLLVHMGKHGHVGHIHCTAWNGPTPVGEQAERNAAFIAASPRLVRDLLLILRRQEEEIQRLKELVTAMQEAVPQVRANAVKDHLRKGSSHA